MTETTTATSTTEDQSQELLYLDPSVIKIGANVRTDLPDAKEFRRSIKERGVIDAVTVYRDQEGDFVCLRGQRRTLTAAEVGTPTGLIPVRVVAKPEDADRIIDQMVENIHRAGMAEKEVLAGVEQLALLGVSAAQIAKRTALARPTVNAALAVVGKDASRARVEAGDLTLEEAAIFAEFEDNPDAIARLERRKQWGHGLEHEAQRLRDEAIERAAYDAEVERLREAGLPVLSGQDAIDAREAVRVSRLRTAAGDAIPEEDWPIVPGAAVLVTEEWVYPEDETQDDPEARPDLDDGDYDEDGDYDGGYTEPVKAYVPVWVLPETAVAIEAGYNVPTRPGHGVDDELQPESEGQAEVRREVRRRVIANNKAWASAETVRREWLTGFLARKTPPKGAEALICEAVVTGQHSLYKAMESNHPMLRNLLGVGADKTRWNCHDEVAGIVAKATTPKASTMTTLGAVIAAWEASIGKHTWRNPTGWDARVLGALVEWGYKASDVESLLLGEDASSDTVEEHGRARETARESADSAA